MRRCLVAGWTCWSGTTNRDSFGGRVPSIDGHKPLSRGAKTLRWANLIKHFHWHLTSMGKLPDMLSGDLPLSFSLSKHQHRHSPLIMDVAICLS